LTPSASKVFAAGQFTDEADRRIVSAGSPPARIDVGADQRKLRMA
jgi:hypothetical protein